ncbi:hypothetical protein HanRHA438_Chr08g0368941 [Helianthus annuus]|uniref:Uncharacterized protein n=1 Tax=Helianthus annuus TaxID=4232 RepID=A0A251S9U5_HELAN|nr:hypothetical protein HanXRQr2_Chr08g0356901 [Helianthus annuus]KAJ0548551.1 hypothetical protein HanIR_Chr08g0385081 [Helianthus annuus]KAJ0899468.1 hypothetical protein HanRHA438_Chr08g0368941 [Helianthus annuus]KAJ0903050.1 hypothetical protein HanPSC8_Chr08g0344571 [Helianthus annuus]
MGFVRLVSRFGSTSGSGSVRVLFLVTSGFTVVQFQVRVAHRVLGLVNKSQTG